MAETERRSAAAVCLLVDLSHSMALRGTWAAAKQTALALHALMIVGRHPGHEPVVCYGIGTSWRICGK